MKKREDNIIEDVKNLFRLKKRTRWQRNLKYKKSFQTEKRKMKQSKDRIIRDIRNLFKQEKED